MAHQLLDTYGGLDLFEQDLGFAQPEWAAWTAVREAARRADARPTGDRTS